MSEVNEEAGPRPKRRLAWLLITPIALLLLLFAWTLVFPIDLIGQSHRLSLGPEKPVTRRYPPQGLGYMQTGAHRKATLRVGDWTYVVEWH